MATHSSTLAWKIPWMEEPGRLHYMGFLRVLHDFTFTFTFHFQALEKEKAIHVVFAWRIPWKGEPGELLSMGSQRVGHNWSDFAEAAEGYCCINIDAVNMGVHISLWDNYFISFEYIFRNEYVSRSVKFHEKLPEDITWELHQYTFQPIIH